MLYLLCSGANNMPTETVEAPPSKIVDHKPAVADTTTLLLRQPVTTTVPARPVLATSLLEMNRMGRPRRGVDYIVSLIFHSALLALLLVVPLYFAQGLHMNQCATTFRVAPPPPPPPLPQLRKSRHNGLGRQSPKARSSAQP